MSDTATPTAEVSVIDWKAERRKCAYSVSYFVHNYVKILDAQAGEWIPFHLWPAQQECLQALPSHQLTIWLKARQLGMTWLSLGYALHTLVMFPGSTTLLFSLRETEAIELLNRLRGMYKRLPAPFRADRHKENTTSIELSSGSRALAFPSNRGDSYTAALAIVDEADLIPKLDDLLGSVKPTIDSGGQLVLLSRSNKSLPRSAFKRIYEAAAAGESRWHPVFLPWSARPGRTPEWYEEQKREIYQRTGSLDALWEQYPATDLEALAARSLDKRLPREWLQQCFQPAKAIPLKELPKGSPSVPGLRVYALPAKGEYYVVGADPAEGNPTSDDSCLCVLNANTGEEVAVLSGKFDPAVFVGHIDSIGEWYNHASVMVERNNHGHAVILGLRSISRLRRLRGKDKNDGWVSSTLGKTILYDEVADMLRQAQLILHDRTTYGQLESIEGATLRAPEGMYDDHADACALAVVGMPQAARGAWKLEAL